MGCIQLLMMGQEEGLCRDVEYDLERGKEGQLNLFVAWDSRCAVQVCLAWREMRYVTGRRRTTHRKSRLRFAGSIINSMSCTFQKGNFSFSGQVSSPRHSLRMCRCHPRSPHPRPRQRQRRQRPPLPWRGQHRSAEQLRPQEDG